MAITVRCGVCGVLVTDMGADLVTQSELNNVLRTKTCSNGHSGKLIAFSAGEAINGTNVPQSVRAEQPIITQVVTTVTNAVGGLVGTIIKSLFP